MTDAPDGFTSDNAELALCAQMNFEAVAKQAPALMRHPLWLIAKNQLDALVKRLSGDSEA